MIFVKYLGNTHDEISKNVLQNCLKYYCRASKFQNVHAEMLSNPSSRKVVAIAAYIIEKASYFNWEPMSHEGMTGALPSSYEIYKASVYYKVSLIPFFLHTPNQSVQFHSFDQNHYLKKPTQTKPVTLVHTRNNVQPVPGSCRHA